jgi:hypothetical protein
MLNSLHFGAVQTVELLLIYLIETQPGNAERSRLRGVRGGRIEFWQSICHVQEANPSIVFPIEFIAFLVHWTLYTGYCTLRS